MRFNVSLVFLIAMLSISAYLLLFSLAGSGKAFPNVPEKTPTVAKNIPRVQNKDQVLNDSSLDFKLTIPFQSGQWMYRIGYVKGLTDDSLDNQFVKIYLTSDSSRNTTNFEECFKGILTIRKFSSAEWKELEKGCEKGNLVYCEGMGSKINEKDGSVWAYIKGENCSNEMKSKCALIEKIIESFQFK